jgi:hypothetical protein
MDVEPAAVELHIETLVLDGVAPADAERVAAALRQALARRIAAGGVPAALAAPRVASSVEAGPYAPGPDAGPEALGAEAARALDAGLRR